jgi:hypothetical protein
MALAIGAVIPMAAPALAQETYTVDANAAQVVPGPGASGAAASATLSLDGDEGVACVGLQLTGFDLDADPITGIAVHEGAVGVSGPVAFELVVPDPPDDNGACSAVDSPAIDAVVADPSAYYLEIDTAAFPDGAVRGQIQAVVSVDVNVAEVVCPGSVKLPTGADVSILFQKCQAVARPGEFGPLQPGYSWRIKPIEAAGLGISVIEGNATEATLADARVMNFSFCDTSTHRCDAALLYDWDGLATGSMSVNATALPTKTKFETAIVVDGDGNLRASEVDKKRGIVRFATTAADETIYVYLVAK